MTSPAIRATSPAMDINRDSRVCIHRRRRPNSARWNSQQIAYGNFARDNLSESGNRWNSSADSLRFHSSPASAGRKGRQPRSRSCANAAALSPLGQRSVGLFGTAMDAGKRLERNCQESVLRGVRNPSEFARKQNGTCRTGQRTQCRSSADNLGVKLHTRALRYTLRSMGARESE
jgi:hypothetical protein